MIERMCIHHAEFIARSCCDSNSLLEAHNYVDFYECRVCGSVFYYNHGESSPERRYYEGTLTSEKIKKIIPELEYQQALGVVQGV
ncbi:MAG: hypothetical protein ABIF08_04780 [Nanoarchaeota archaeon]